MYYLQGIYRIFYFFSRFSIFYSSNSWSCTRVHKCNNFYPKKNTSGGGRYHHQGSQRIQPVHVRLLSERHAQFLISCTSLYIIHSDTHTHVIKNVSINKNVLPFSYTCRSVRAHLPVMLYKINDFQLIELVTDIGGFGNWACTLCVECRYRNIHADIHCSGRIRNKRCSYWIAVYR